jgi:[acyl-carrier-protein] S-malonyltransferase
VSARIAFLFPGQGSQVVGMGQDLLQEFGEAKAIFATLDATCRKPISRLCFEGPLEELTLTVNLQPAVTAVNLACLAALKRSHVTPWVSAGHSLGEYAALVSAGVLSESNALALANKRGELMHRESLRNPGSMAAVMGLSASDVEEIVRQAGQEGGLAVANYNTAQQIVITGEKKSIDRAADLVKQKGGKAIPLPVSGAWHSPLMKDAVEELQDFMAGIPFSRPQSAMIFNATAEVENDPAKIRVMMAHQLIRPVRWHEILLRMLQDGVDTFVEVGPKNVLTGLLKKTLPRDSSARTYNVGDLKGLKSFLEGVG